MGERESEVESGRILFKLINYAEIFVSFDTDTAHVVQGAGRGSSIGPIRRKKQKNREGSG